MSNLQNLLENTNELVFTAEFPSIDGGGMDKFKEVYKKELEAVSHLNPVVDFGVFSYWM